MNTLTPEQIAEVVKASRMEVELKLKHQEEMFLTCVNDLHNRINDTKAQMHDINERLKVAEGKFFVMHLQTLDYFKRIEKQADKIADIEARIDKIEHWSVGK